VAAVPPELRDAKRWVVWRWTWKPPEGKNKGKWDKPPIDAATGLDIDATDPANWMAFDEARRVARNHGDGIGIALGPKDNRLGIVGVDLDDCIDADGNIDPEGIRIVRSLDSYTEQTPSGKGLRVLIRGKKPGDKCKHTKRKIEIYEADRYFTVTGRHLEGTPTVIADRQKLLDALYHELFGAQKNPQPKPADKPNGELAASDEELLDKARRARNGAKFSALYDEGDTGAHGEDDSAADQALMNHLAFWFDRDPSRMEAVFSRSALGQREKWRDRPGYRMRTIDAAIARCVETYSPSRNGPVAGGSATSGDKAAGAGPSPEKESQAQILLRLAGAATLFHDPGGRAYAAVPAGKHTEVHAVRSTGFGLWLKRQFYSEQSKPPSAQSYQDALGLIEAQAIFDGPEEPVFIRVAGDSDRIIIDLADPEWRVVVITGAGWSVADQSPVRFRRPAGLRPLPLPQRGGSIKDLTKFVNCEDAEFILIVAWLAAALRPSGPYPLPILIGEAGSAKTTVARVLRLLVDPHKMPLRGQPKEERDLMVAAHNNWVVGLDNLSVLWDWVSDALCRLATGGGFGSRTLYSDDEETVLEAQRPVILTGIADFARKEDLIDRGIFFHLPPIPDTRRRPESAFWANFSQAHPKLLGAVFDAVAGGLRELPKVSGTNLPRMADFARFGEAVSRGLGYPRDHFLKIYRANRKGAAETALEDSPVAGAILRLIAQSGLWEGTASDLLAELTEIVGEKAATSKRWPKSPRGLSGAVKGLAPSLRLVGFRVECGRGHNRFLRIEGATEREGGNQPTRPAQPATSPPQPSGVQADADSDPCAGYCAHSAPVGSQPTQQAQTGAPTDAPELAETPRVTSSGDGCDGCDGQIPPRSGRRIREVF
jgi:hypothetical protein